VIGAEVLAAMVLAVGPAALGDAPVNPGGIGPELDFWSFGDTNAWRSDFGFAPLSFTNIWASPLGIANAMVLDSTNAAWLRYNVTETSGTNNLTVNQGTLMFWFAPDWAGTNQGGTGPGEWGRLIETGAYTTNAAYGWWSLYFDAVGCNLYFSGQTNNGSQATFLQSPVNLTSNYWHLVALTYSATGSALYWDGLLLTNGSAPAYLPNQNVLTNGFWIGSSSNGLNQARGMFSEISTYNYVVDAVTIAGTYNLYWIFYNRNPMDLTRLGGAPSYPTNYPVFEAINGSGYLQPIGTAAGCVSSSQVWLTNVTATLTNNGTINLTFSIMGGSNGLYYDVFAAPELAPGSITNSVWSWMGQGQHCTTYLITNLPPFAALVLLGTPQDSDQDGLTDAYELLVSHTDPQNYDTLGVGMSDGFQVGYFGGMGIDPYADADGMAGQTSRRCKMGRTPFSLTPLRRRGMFLRFWMRPAQMLL
jgi:hypothetical protein